MGNYSNVYIMVQIFVCALRFSQKTINVITVWLTFIVKIYYICNEYYITVVNVCTLPAF
jgi:hypothetical protein